MLNLYKTRARGFWRHSSKLDAVFTTLNLLPTLLNPDTAVPCATTWTLALVKLLEDLEKEVGNIPLDLAIIPFSQATCPQEPYKCQTGSNYTQHSDTEKLKDKIVEEFQKPPFNIYPVKSIDKCDGASNIIWIVSPYDLEVTNLKYRRWDHVVVCLDHCKATVDLFDDLVKIFRKPRKRLSIIVNTSTPIVDYQTFEDWICSNLSTNERNLLREVCTNVSPTVHW